MTKFLEVDVRIFLIDSQIARTLMEKMDKAELHFLPREELNFRQTETKPERGGSEPAYFGTIYKNGDMVRKLFTQH